MLDVGGQQLSLAELRRGASEMAENNNVTIIDGPTPFVFDGATAVSVKTEASFVGQDTTVRGFTVLVSTSHRFFYIEVAGLASYEGLLNNIFNDFMSGFRILE